MKTSNLVAMALALCIPAVGCGDDSGTGSGGADGTGGSTTGDVATPATTTGADSTGAESTGVASNEGDGSTSTADSTGEPPPVEVTVEGEVVDFVAMATPIAGAEISVFGNPGPTATSDAEGLFSIGTFEPDTTAHFVLAPNETYLGAIVPAAIESDELQEDQQLSQIPRAFVDIQLMLLEGMMPEPPDLTQSIIIVRLINNAAVMEGATTIDMTPAPAPGTFYAPDETGAAILNENDITFGALPVVVYFNVDASDPGDISFEATHPTRDCEVLFPDFPTLGEHITLVDITCL
ncbi:MAG: hypothetical protein AAF799_10820 [Myxococcota bacterium]